MQIVHGNEGPNHRYRKADDRNQGGAEVEQETQADNAHDKCFEKKIALQSADGFLNEARAVVTRHDLDSGRQCRLNFGQLLLHAVDNAQRVQPVAHDDDAAHRLTLSLPFSNTFTNVRAEGDIPDILDQNWSAISCG